MAKVLKKNNFHVVISDLREEDLKNAEQKLHEIKSKSEVAYKICNVTNASDIKELIEYVEEKFQTIDIWVNNAGINQPDKAIWELDDSAINAVIDVDLKGTIMCSKYVIQHMTKQKKGAIYNVEGYGSNDATMLGLSIYGTAKRGITYFTGALAKECKEKNNGIIIGKLSPGIMITDFITNALANKEKIVLNDKTKKVYNILGDYPDVVANYLVREMIINQKNNVKIDWLPTSKAAWRFLTYPFNKRDFFNK